MGFVHINAEFNINEDLAFAVHDENGKEIGSFIMKDEELSFYHAGTRETTKFDTEDKFNDWANENKYTFRKIDSNRFVKYNPNPQGKNTGDCTIRAYCKAENLTWDEAYDIASKYGKAGAALPDDHSIVNKILTDEFGYAHTKFTKEDPVKTVNEFAIEHPTGKYVLSVASHLVTVIDGYFYDTWDSGKRKVKGVYEPTRVD